MGLVVVLALAWMQAFAGPGARAAGGDDGWETLNQPAKAFTIKDLDGRALDSAALRGRVVVIDFWATWCAPCVQELPELEAWKRRLEGRDDVVLLSLNVTEDLDTVREFARRKAMRAPIYLGDDLLGPYNVGGFPTKLILDLRGAAPGRLRFRREGGPVSVASIAPRVAPLVSTGSSI